MLRVEEYLGRYIAGEAYEHCLKPHNPEYLIEVKRGYYDLAEARVIAKTAIDNVVRISDAFTEVTPNEGDPKVDEILNNAQRDMMKHAIAIELMEDEYYD